MPGTFSPAADLKGNRWLAIPASITARARRMCRDACRDRLPAATGKTFPAFPTHAHPQFCVSDKRPMSEPMIISCSNRQALWGQAVINTLGHQKPIMHNDLWMVIVYIKSHDRIALYMYTFTVDSSDHIIVSIVIALPCQPITPLLFSTVLIFSIYPIYNPMSKLL